jgi:D-glycero-D-manno-heptose 1,7-bisphosphate phosphatase
MDGERRTMRAVFLDKDGTLVEDIPYNVDPELLTLTWQAGPALQLFQQSGYALFVVTNQPGIAKGLFAEAALERVERRLSGLLAQYGVVLSGFYYCPHSPDGTVSGYAMSCGCRKPLPGMLFRAASEHGIDLARSWMIGDILHDVEAGRRAGCQTALIDNGHETEWMMTAQRTPHMTAPNLYVAAQIIASMNESWQRSAIHSCGTNV